MRGFLNFPSKLSRICNSIIFALILCAFYALVMLLYPRLLFKLEWREEQESFENSTILAVIEKERIETAASKLSKIGTKYTLSSSDLEGLLEGFLNNTELTSAYFTFYWTQYLCHFRMFGNAFMMYDDSSVIFYNITTQILTIIFRTILPVLATFILACGVSAIHSVLMFIVRPFFNISKYSPMTRSRNRLIKIRDLLILAFATFYLAFSFITGSIALARWQNCSISLALGKIVQLLTTVLPDMEEFNTIKDTYILSACFLHISTGMSYFLYAILRVLKTFRYCNFEIPLIEQIAEAHEVDKNVQEMYNFKRKKMLNGELMD